MVFSLTFYNYKPETNTDYQTLHNKMNCINKI